MKYFKLPDLGEGLTEAEIVEWHIQPGDKVTEDQTLLTVETAKALIELPSPQAGKVTHLFGQPGDLLHIGEPLLEFEAGEDQSQSVVGEIPVAHSDSRQQPFIVGAAQTNTESNSIRVTPAVRALANRLQVDIHAVKASGHQGQITPADIERAAQLAEQHGPALPLKGTRRHMATRMQQAHAEVVPVTLTEQVSIAHWPEDADITLKLIQAIAHACAQVPEMNSWFDGQLLTWRQHTQLDLGIAVDTEQGLFVPVLRDVTARSGQDLRQGLDRLRKDVAARSIPPQEMQGATFTLSNFGMLGGLFATPIVIPPQIGILAVGRKFAYPVPSDAGIRLAAHLPFSLTFDHRALTGAEAARFLAAVTTHLQK
ncbi:dihydrolipoamide acetyltransferase family protein [Neptuniibacter sp. CAU 1671]|uniref:dihydrolipoamide acetyltransferase family protein n=1 Tax=Neptuniibacter sp. CAU 1671 TaxID=3032593 RepID=UPI0023DBCF29|nr:dihydrolipoamide acetyltransferase family protein [Neptuniibacter sp. CAU 1671]MDF2182256.1 dihydrolipoamide acetyltransferase family protein [Neptuniibacter sp. CAU 1671]